MSHFVVGVLLPEETPIELIENAVDMMLEPYDENKQMEDGEYNPKSKWDWYDIGGRWHNFLKLKRDCITDWAKEFGSTTRFDATQGSVDLARIGQIDFSGNDELYRKNYRWWQVAIEDAALEEGEKEEDFQCFFKKEFYIDRYKNAETYAKIQSSIIFYSMVMPDGSWEQKGNMGWFGMSDESNEESLNWDLNFYDNYIKNLPPDTILVTVDCHI